MSSKLKSLLTAGVSIIALNTGSAFASSSPEIKETMNEASKSLSILIPYAYNDEKFRADSEKQRVQAQLKNLNQLFTKKSELLAEDSDTAWITLKVLQHHLEETEELYSAGYYAMSQYLLTSTPALCSTCHIQDSAHSSIQSSLQRSNFANDFSYGEYLFTIRNYEKSKQFYNDYLKDPEVRASRIRYLKPLERLLTIELGISQSKENANKLLKTHQSHIQQIEIKQVINEWLSGLTGISSAANTFEELQPLFTTWFANAPNNSHEFILDESKRPQAIWLRAKLYDALKSNLSKEQTANTLYMLAILNRILGQDEPYSFANLYLKQCVISYPKTDSAKLCLDEYKSHLSFYYGGSAGEAVPEELVKEYLSMKDKLDNATK